MLMTIGGMIAAFVLLSVSLFMKKAWLTKFTLGGIAVWVAFYAVMLLRSSLSSKEKMFGMNEAKEYCGFYLDCHLHTAVTGIRSAKNIGDKQANGRFYIVNVKVFSNARNPAIAFRLLEPKAELTDGRGQKYVRDTDTESRLPTAQVQLNQAIKGGQTIEKEIVFDVAEPATDLKLLITEGYGIDKYIEAVLIDDEDSLCNKRTFFNIAEQAQTASQNRER